MNKQTLINIGTVILGIGALIIGTYIIINFFSPTIPTVPEQDPSAGVLPKEVSY